MRKLRHESVARDLTARAEKMIQQGSNCEPIEVNINMFSCTIRRVDQRIEFWSADKMAEISLPVSRQEMYEMFLGVLNQACSRDYLIDYIV